MNLALTPTGWEDFTYWEDKDRATSKKVRALLKAEELSRLKA